MKWALLFVLSSTATMCVQAQAQSTTVSQLAGSTSGVITEQVQAAAGTYNWNLPIAAGTAGYSLLSGGGGGAPMSFGILGVAAGGTNTGSTLSGLVRGGASYTAAEISGDCTTSGSNSITCTKTSGTSLGTFATQNYATPPAIGGTTPAAGAFTTLSSSSPATLDGTTVPASQTLLYSGGALGTPASGTLTNAAGLPTTGLTGTLQAAQEAAHTGDATNTAGSLALTVGALNGIALSGLATGLLKNTTTTGVPSIAAYTDIFTLFTGCSGTDYPGYDGACHAAGGGGVTSVALTVPAGFAIGGSPITTSGTLAVTYATGQTANEVLATPNGSSGALGIRALVAADIPTISLTSGVSGALQAAQEPAHTGDATNSAGSLAMTVSRLNGTALSGLATGILKNTTATGVPSIAASADIIGLFSSCSGTQYLGADGTCHTASGSGTVTTTGSPSSGDMAKFSGSTSITTAVAGTDYPGLASTNSFSGSNTFTSTVNLNSTAVQINGNLLVSKTLPTVSGTGLGTSPSITAHGTAGMYIVVGSSPSAATFTITLPTSTTGWVCRGDDITTRSTTVASLHQVGYSATTAVMQIYGDTMVAESAVASDHLLVTCWPI